MDMVFAAQLWKDNSGRLENKNGDWMYMEETWILPNESQTKDGQMIRNALGKVLKADSESKGMHLKKFKTQKNFAKWKFISFKLSLNQDL